MPDRKQAHIKRNITQAKQEKNHACQEQQMIITCDHVFGAKIHVGDELQPSDAFEITCILLRDSMRKYGLGKCTHRQENQCREEHHSDRRCTSPGYGSGCCNEIMKAQKSYLL